CGGAFGGLENIVAQRTEGKSLGFGSDVKAKKERNISELLRDVQPEDLLKFGMIPEFIGRLPVVATLEELDEAALVDILTKPRNALAKQYRKLLEMDGVQLKFTDGALRAVAKEAIRHKSGARGLRAILENSMLNVMYEVPSHKNIREIVLNEDCILKKEAVLVEDDLADVLVRGHFVHHVQHRVLEDGPQSARAALVANGLLRHRPQGAVGELELHAVHLQQLAVLLGQGVPRLGEDVHQRRLVQLLERRDHGEAPDELRNHA